MSDLKRTCPACDAWTSSVGIAFRDGEPCPYCGRSQSSPDWTDNRDDVARAIALVDSLVDPPLSGKYGRYADAAIAALSAASSARTAENRSE